MITQTEKACGGASDKLTACIQNNKGDVSKCQDEIKEVDLCVGSVLCPVDGRKLRDCLRSGTASRSSSARMGGPSCIRSSLIIIVLGRFRGEVRSAAQVVQLVRGAGQATVLGGARHSRPGVRATTMMRYHARRPAILPSSPAHAIRLARPSPKGRTRRRRRRTPSLRSSMIPTIDDGG